MEEKGRGKLYVVEGACDGIGKSTQYALLKERLEKDGEQVVPRLQNAAERKDEVCSKTSFTAHASHRHCR